MTSKLERIKEINKQRLNQLRRTSRNHKSKVMTREEISAKVGEDPFFPTLQRNMDADDQMKKKRVDVLFGNNTLQNKSVIFEPSSDRVFRRKKSKRI